MASDFEAEVATGLARMDSAARALGNAFDQVQAKSRSALDTQTAGLQKTSAAAKKTKEDVDNIQKSTKDLGAALARVGGPIGETIGKLSGGAGMSGGLAGIAIAAGVAGVAIKTFNVILNDQREQIAKNVEALARFRSAKETALKAGTDARTERGIAAVGKEGLIRQLGTADEVKQAQGLAFDAGTSFEDAAKARIALRRMDPRTRIKAIEIAAQVAKTGEFSAESVTERYGNDAAFRAAARTPEGALAAMRGRPLSRSALNEARDTLSGANGDGTAGQSLIIRRSMSRLDNQQVSDFLSGRTGMAVDKDVDKQLTSVQRAMDAPMKELFKQMREDNLKLIDELHQTQMRGVASMVESFARATDTVLGTSTSLRRKVDQSTDRLLDQARASGEFRGASQGR